MNPNSRSCHSSKPEICLTHDKLSVGRKPNATHCDVLGPNEFYETNLMPISSRLCERSVSSPVLSVQNQHQIQHQQTSSGMSNNHSALHVDVFPESTSQTLQPITGIEEEVDSLHLHDVCSKWFTRDVRSGGRPMPLIGKSCSHQSNQSSHNLTQTLHDKVMPKETIVKTFDISPKQRINHQLDSNYSSRVVEKVASSEQSHVTTNRMEDRHVVVVNCFEDCSRDCSLKVQQQIDVAMQNAANEVPMKIAAERIASSGSQDVTYKSSSESGRGTMGSDGLFSKKRDNGTSPADNSSLDSDQSGPPVPNTWESEQNKTSTGNIIEHMQQELQRILDDGVIERDRNGVCRLPVVLESDSWVSDSTTSRNVFAKEKKQDSESRVEKQNCKPESGKNMPSIASRNIASKPEKPTVVNRPIPKSRSIKAGVPSKVPVMNKGRCIPVINGKYREGYHKSAHDVSTAYSVDIDYPDDLTSEYTANTSNWDLDETMDTKKQLAGLETMYSQILTLLTSRMKGAKKNLHIGHRMRRRTCGSVSGRSSVASRSTHHDSNYRYRNKPENRAHKYEDTKTSNARLKRLEAHVVTLARSVAQLSSEIRTHHSIVQEVDKLRKEVDRLNEQFRTLKSVTGIDAVGSLKRNTIGKQDMLSSCNGREIERLKHEFMGNANAGRFEKLKRFFGDEPPIMKQFLKKLGYEKYASKFESEKIGINELIYMTDERLQKLGIPMGPRIRILQETNKLKNGNIYKV